LTELLYCVNVAFRMSEWIDQLHHDNAPARSTAIVHPLLSKHHITQVCQPPHTAKLWLPATCGFSQS